MPKSIGAQIPIERKIWWFLESREEHFEKTETQITQIPVKL